MWDQRALLCTFSINTLYHYFFHCLELLVVTAIHFSCLLVIMDCLSLVIVEQKQLVAQKIHIEENEDRDTGLEQRHYKEDPDCVMAKVPLGDLDLYDGTYISLESKDIR